MCRVGGIQLAVHGSFVLLLLFYGFEGWQAEGWSGAAWRVTLIVLFFVCVVLHELGHSFTALRHGVRVPRILLLPIGGMAEFDHIPRRPRTELLITAAGPAVNFLLVAVLLPFVWTDLWGAREQTTRLGGLLLELTFANGVMGIFNLLPVFPMDGGRIFRALLATRVSYARATWWAAGVGKVLALAFALAAAFWLEQWLLTALFVFIFFVGDAESRQVMQHERAAADWAAWQERVRAEEPAARVARDADAPPRGLHGPN